MINIEFNINHFFLCTNVKIKFVKLPFHGKDMKKKLKSCGFVSCIPSLPKISKQKIQAPN
jgi:hypothetical protein